MLHTCARLTVNAWSKVLKYTSSSALVYDEKGQDSQSCSTHPDCELSSQMKDQIFGRRPPTQFASEVDA